MSHDSNTTLYERVAEVIATTQDEELKRILEGYLDVNDLESVGWILAHLPEEEQSV